MHKKGVEGGMMWIIVGMIFAIIALVVVGFIFFGPDQLLAKGTKPIGETAGGLSSDYDNDGRVDTIDPCPCDANIEPTDGRCPTGFDECKKLREEKAKTYAKK